MPTKIIIYSGTAVGKTTHAKRLSKEQNIPLFDGDNQDEIMNTADAQKFAQTPHPCIATIYGDEFESAFFRFKRLLGFNYHIVIPVKMIPTIR